MASESAQGAGSKKRIIAAVIAAVLVLGGGAVAWWALAPKASDAAPSAPGDSAAPKDPEASTTPSPSATPTPPPLSKQAMDGYWRAVPADQSSFVVRGDSVVYETGTRMRVLSDEGGQADFVSVIAEDAASCADAAVGACAPLGQLVPAGTAVQIPDYAAGVTDVIDADRIWDGQGGVLYVREALPTEQNFPEDLRGDWCSEDGTVCFSLNDLLAEHPFAFLQSTAETSHVPGAVDASLCLVADLGPEQCSTAASMPLRYFAEGVKWDCAAYVKKVQLGEITECDPTTVVKHNTSKDRLLMLPSHQHDQKYIDSEPLYRK